jgi:hypothetical protein
MPPWLARLSGRERNLALIVGGLIFLFINLFVWGRLIGGIKQARVDLEARKATRKAQSVYMKEKGMWEARAEWLKAHQPAMKSPSDASALLDQIKEVANKHNLLVENPAIGTGEANANYRSAYATVETKSPWPPLVRFLYDIQQPDSFIVFESVSLGIDGSDQTQMRGKFKIARWFAPGAIVK